MTVQKFACSQYRQLRARENRNRRRGHLLQNPRHRGLGEHDKVYFRDQVCERLTHHAIVRFGIARQNGFKGAIAAPNRLAAHTTPWLRARSCLGNQCGMTPAALG